MMKKLTALLTALFLLLSATALADEMIHIGIIQFAEHGSLDNCRIGFIEGLAEEGFVEGENVVFDVQNAQADTAISAQIADVMAGKYDMICAIATPAAMAAFNAAEDAGIPVIYTAVSDPSAPCSPVPTARTPATSPARATRCLWKPSSSSSAR